MPEISRSRKIKVAIIGSGNIGTDLMIKVMRTSDVLEMGAFVGIDPESDGLKRAQRLGIPTTHNGIGGLVALPVWPDIKIVFDATSAAAHKKHYEACVRDGKVIIDLTPAAIGPYVIPGCERRRASRRGKCQYGHVRRSGDDPNRCRRKRVGHRSLCRDCRFDCVEIGRTRHPCKYR